MMLRTFGAWPLYSPTPGMDCKFDKSVAFPFFALCSHNFDIILFSTSPELWWIFKRQLLHSAASLWKHQRRLFTSHEFYGTMDQYWGREDVFQQILQDIQEIQNVHPFAFSSAL